jgi:hypothetical protein
MESELEAEIEAELELRLKQNHLGPLSDVGVIQGGTSIEIMKVITTDYLLNIFQILPCTLIISFVEDFA